MPAEVYYDIDIVFASLHEHEPCPLVVGTNREHDQQQQPLCFQAALFVCTALCVVGAVWLQTVVLRWELLKFSSWGLGFVMRSRQGLKTTDNLANNDSSIVVYGSWRKDVWWERQYGHARSCCFLSTIVFVRFKSAYRHGVFCCRHAFLVANPSWWMRGWLQKAPLLFYLLFLCYWYLRTGDTERLTATIGGPVPCRCHVRTHARTPACAIQPLLYLLYYYH